MGHAPGSSSRVGTDVLVADGSRARVGHSCGRGCPAPPEEETTDPDCDQVDQATASDNETFDEASTASFEFPCVEFDAATDAADDPEVSSPILALADDSRSMTDSAAGARGAIDRNDAARGQVYADAFSAGCEAVGEGRRHLQVALHLTTSTEPD